MVLEEIEGEIESVKQAGARAFESEDLRKADEALERSKQLVAFRDEVAAIRDRWQALAKPDGGAGQSGAATRRDLGRLPNGRRTPESAFVEPILRVLADMGGHGRASDIVARVGRIMMPRLRDVDFEPLPADGKPRWTKTVNWARFQMVRARVLKADSPRGIWEVAQSRNPADERSREE